MTGNTVALRQDFRRPQKACDSISIYTARRIGVTNLSVVLLGLLRHLCEFLRHCVGGGMCGLRFKPVRSTFRVGFERMCFTHTFVRVKVCERSVRRLVVKEVGLDRTEDL